jgi:hypothetical protein
LTSATFKNKLKSAANPEVRVPMQVQKPWVGILSIVIIISIVFGQSVAATEGSWQLVDYEYLGLYESLSGNSIWVLNHTRGPDDRWVIDLTISGYGVNPTTVIICDEAGYERWHSTGSTSLCTFVESVNSTLASTVDLTHLSQWYFVMNNTSPAMLYFRLTLARYRWSIEQPITTTSDFLANLGSIIGSLVIIAVVVLFLIPCVCGCGCTRRKRGRRRRTQDSEVHHHYTTYLVVSPDHIDSIGPLEDEDRR